MCITLHGGGLKEGKNGICSNVFIKLFYFACNLAVSMFFSFSRNFVIIYY